jgi:hypothetical protein
MSINDGAGYGQRQGTEFKREGFFAMQDRVELLTAEVAEKSGAEAAKTFVSWGTICGMKFGAPVSESEAKSKTNAKSKARSTAADKKCPLHTSCRTRCWGCCAAWDAGLHCVRDSYMLDT